ncbi:hybrid sensor histidine kinase/response regulator [Blastopirellula retiformator]|uniref:Transcriptional regulatory protein ZraR n=1 Tax=Blastopirellula retiformator TaxID=2527970 RepID=A0A5C5V3Y9_9BACT|nr:response regulator [Blastopirellula retiformator]TWT33286.1 Transcriptional regulatory protein ZraR [Blastopirellula retiformator]
MAGKPKILCLCAPGGQHSVLEQLRTDYDITEVQTPLRTFALLKNHEFDGVYICTDYFEDSSRIGNLLQNERILEGMPDGVAMLDRDNTVLWANSCLQRWAGCDDVVGRNFYGALNSPEILGPDFCPFHTALTSGRPSTSTLRTEDNQYYQVHAAPVLNPNASPKNLIVTIRDVTEEVLQRQKLEAIHKAGIELADLTTEEIFNMEVSERIELLKSNILHYTKDLLNFDVIEIRVLDQRTGELVPLLSVGIDKEAAERELYAQSTNNGVTGFVASTGKSYLCEDTQSDPLYLEGFKGAKSSLTVPLILHDAVIGSFNVESPEPRAFTESDLQFLEIFCRDLALALNTLELLSAQQANTAQASVEAIHSAVALPVDEILNDAVNVMERYIGHDEEVVDRVRRIIQNGRDIKRVIQKVGERMTPSKAVPASVQAEVRPRLRGARVLVVDEDESVRSAAHALLDRYGCDIETAHDGAEALCMVRAGLHGAGYDAIICDVHLPDMSGNRLYQRLKDIVTPVPMILMTGFGYDPGHSIVKARQTGLLPNAVLYKPFRLDDLLATVERIIEAYADQAQTASQ